MLRSILRGSIIAASVTLALAGCGSDSKTSTSGSSSSSASAATPVSLPGTTNEPKTGDATSGSIEIELDDFYFGPSFVKGKPGETITLHLKNEGKNPHTFTSTALQVDETLQPDSNKDVTVTM